MPVADKFSGKVRKAEARTAFLYKFLQGRAEAEPPGTGVKESCPVGCILHVVGKGQCLFVIVKFRGKDLGEFRTDFCGASKSHHGKSPSGTAKGTDELPVIFASCGADGIGKNNVCHLGAAVITEGRLIRSNLYVKTLGTDPAGDQSPGDSPVVMGKHHDNLVIGFKVEVVEGLQAGKRGISSFT